MNYHQNILSTACLINAHFVGLLHVLTMTEVDGAAGQILAELACGTEGRNSLNL